MTGKWTHYLWSASSSSSWRILSFSGGCTSGRVRSLLARGQRSFKPKRSDARSLTGCLSPAPRSAHVPRTASPFLWPSGSLGREAFTVEPAPRPDWRAGGRCRRCACSGESSITRLTKTSDMTWRAAKRECMARQRSPRPPRPHVDGAAFRPGVRYTLGLPEGEAACEVAVACVLSPDVCVWRAG